MHDFFCVCVFSLDFLFGRCFFYNRKSAQRLIRERSFTKKPPILTIPYFTNCQSVEVLSACSSVQQYRTNEKSIRYCYNCNIAKD